METMRPRRASLARLLIHTSPATHSRLPETPSRKRSGNHSHGSGRSGNSSSTAAASVRLMPMMRAGESTASSRCANGARNKAGSACAAVERPTIVSLAPMRERLLASSGSDSL